MNDNTGNTTLQNPSEKEREEFMAKVRKTLGLQVTLHLMHDGRIAIGILVDGEQPKNFQEYCAMPADDMKLHAYKSEVIQHIIKFEPTSKLNDVLNADEEAIDRIKARAGEKCDCPACKEKEQSLH